MSDYIGGHMRKQNKSYEPSKGLAFITRNKKVVATIIITLYLLVMIIIGVCLRGDLEQIAYSSEIVGGIFIMAGLVISVLQYTASSVENTILREKEKKVRAAEIANEFQAEIIPLSSMLADAYAKSGLDKDLLVKIEKKKLEMFDKDEVLSIVSLEEISQAYARLYGGYLSAHYTEKNLKRDADGKVTGVRFSKEEKDEAEQTIDLCIQNLSNKLEYFGICLNSGIADEDTVYQSLHSVFFQCVHMMYVFIFYSNTSESDRFFANMSSLYVRWKERYEKLVEQENKELINLKKNVKDRIVVKAKK